MNWFLLILAGLLEVIWAVGLKYTEGFTKLWPSVITGSAMLLSIVLLGFAMKSLPMSTAYAIWVGIGIIGTAIFGIVYLHEPGSVIRVLSITLILLGLVGLKFSS